jgi:phage terminase Nu1 subunit (DNA packaging protein)
MKTAKRRDMEFKTKELAELFEVSDRSIRNWTAKGMPRIAPGRFEGLPVIRWYAENIFLAEAAESRDLLSKPEAERLMLNLKAELLQCEVDREKGKFVEVEEVRADWIRIAQGVKAKLYSIPFRLSALLAGESEEFEIRKMIKQEVNRALDEISQGKNTCPGCGCKLWPEDELEAKTDGK